MADILSSADDVEKCRELFVMDLDGYWKEHVQFGTDAGTAPVRMTKGSVDLLLINLVAPLVYAHCGSVGEYERGEKVFDILMELPPEQNTYIRQWSQSGIKCEDAMHSQALLQLRKAYCDENRCLECRFGHALLRKSVNRWE